MPVPRAAGVGRRAGRFQRADVRRVRRRDCKISRQLRHRSRRRPRTLFQQAAARNIRLRGIAANFAGGVVVAAKARAIVDDVISRMNSALARAEENRRPVSVPVYVPVRASEAAHRRPPAGWAAQRGREPWRS
jgi:hypothetical protein